MKNFRDLKVWERAHNLTLKIYEETGSFPADEKYALTSQIRRAAFSVPNNIAEGCGRDSDPDLARFLTISMGSASELEYLLLLAKDLKMLNGERYKELSQEVIEIKRMLASFITKLKSKKLIADS